MGCCFSPARQNTDIGVDEGSSDELPQIGFPNDFKGSGVSIDNASLSITGTGSALASAPIEQDAAYWEVVIRKPGVIRIGVSRKLPPSELNKVLPATQDPAQPTKWWCVDCSDARINAKAGDVVGVAFGQSDLPNLSFHVNGIRIDECSVKKIGGLVYPCFIVDGDAEMGVVFQQSSFKHTPPSGFKPLMVVRSLI